ncbi:hypothetical protein Pan241w_33700 [Gimesia alba]|uniref:Uncharacterized protein n=1 Tax=Gimesia alba TaxID=2527973 RepID=A0A517RHD2_9PLAN|nr:hypothetical protein [Gimesia alba]QDT43270.1 hypothetical protein Pan241w_33700 [Gimesia alba]
MRFSQTFCVAVCSFGLALFVGCSSKDDTRTFDDKDSQASEEAEHAHDHAHEHGPNGGHLLEVGEEQYHMEVVFDNGKRTLTAFILGPDAKTPFPIEGESIDFDLEVGDDEHEIPLAAKPLEGEKEGKSSRFVAEGKAIPDSIKAESDLNGHFHLDVGEDHFHVDLEHGDHDHGDHKGHDHDDHKHDEKPEAKKADAAKAEPAKTEDKKESPNTKDKQ